MFISQQLKSLCAIVHSINQTISAAAAAAAAPTEDLHDILTIPPPTPLQALVRAGQDGGAWSAAGQFPRDLTGRPSMTRQTTTASAGSELTRQKFLCLRPVLAEAAHGHGTSTEYRDAAQNMSHNMLRRSESGQGFTEVGVATSLEPLTSIDSLFQQAACLRPIMQRKVDQYLSIIPRADRAYRVAPMRLGEGSSTAVVMALKQPERAIQKALRCYGGDCSRILDICRDAVVFDRLEELQLMLEVLHRLVLYASFVKDNLSCCGSLLQCIRSPLVGLRSLLSLL